MCHLQVNNCSLERNHNPDVLNKMMTKVLPQGIKCVICEPLSIPLQEKQTLFYLMKMNLWEIK
jgi:hypothetical protein